MKVVLAHPGTQYAFRLAHEIENMGMLKKFVTSLGVNENSALVKLLPTLFRNRVVRGVPSSRLKNYPSLELMSQLRTRLGVDGEKLLYYRNSAFQDKVILNDLNDVDAVIGFDTSSWTLAEYCRKHNIPFILDVSIGHPSSKEKVFSMLRSSFSSWTDISKPKRQELIDLEQRELTNAARVVVPSSFVKQTLIDNGVDASKISVIPFGTDITAFGNCARPETRSPITFLFFGSLTARKGLPLLIDAWSRIDHGKARLIVAGYGKIPADVTIPHGVTITGSVGPGEKKALFESADVFVFPSYFEGLAQVQLEAAASGLPIIGTTNSGAAEIVKEGKNGFDIKPGDTEALIQSLQYFIGHPERIKAMGEESRTIMKDFGWDAYASKWKTLLTQI